MEIIKNNGKNLAFVSDRLKDNKEIVLEACKNLCWLLPTASERLRNDKDIALEVCKNDKLAFEYLGDKIKEQFPTIEALLDSEKKISKNNQWSKETEDKTNTWNDKVNSDKDNQWEI